MNVLASETNGFIIGLANNNSLEPFYATAFQLPGFGVWKKRGKHNTGVGDGPPAARIKNRLMGRHLDKVLLYWNPILLVCPYGWVSTFWPDH